MMQRKFHLVLLLVSLLLCACNNSAGSATSGEAESSKANNAAKPLPNADEIVKRVITQDGSKDFTAEMRMTSESSDGKRAKVDFRLQRKYSPDGAATFLTVLSPREESDKALLAIEHEGKPTEAFSYLAGLRKLATLDSSRTLGFRGSKVLVQELLGMELGQYSHTAGERVNMEGEQLIKIEFTEKKYLNLAFPRIVGYFREENQQPVRFELFGKNGELQKKAVVEEVKTIQGHQTITKVRIDDQAQNLKLELETLKIDYDRGLPDKLFTEDHLISTVTEASRKLDAVN